jgi:hypothetical protein
MLACCRCYPGGTTGCSCRSLPQRWQPSLQHGQVGFRIVAFEALSAFNSYGLQARGVTEMTLCIVGFDDLVTSFVATIATGWSDPCRVGLSPTEKPRLHAAHRAVPTTPANQAGAHVDCFPARAAFPNWQEGLHPHCHFRGLRRLYSRYGPSDRSATQGGYCHEASMLPVTQRNRSLASGPIDNYPGGTLLHLYERLQGALPI